MSKVWSILTNREPRVLTEKEIVDLLLQNRGIVTEESKEEFLDPPNPLNISLKEVGINEKEVGKALKRITTALKKHEKVVIFGDYDADGVTGTAIVWEYLYLLGLDVTPHLPERFSEGYGLQQSSIALLREKHPGLKVIITVDNGIVAHEACIEAKKHGIDIIMTDHHEPLGTFPVALAMLHTTKVSGSAVAWFFIRELAKSTKEDLENVSNLLELTAIGTIADQLPLVGINRSIVTHGLSAINKTKRAGLLELIDICGIKRGSIGSYEIGFAIAPRINAMGRMKHAIDSLRLICTKDKKKAQELAFMLNDTNMERQKTVEEVVLHARESTDKNAIGPLVLAHESYHEGVIGLAAAKLVEEFYLPAIVFSKGVEFSKASARSISGFNIIDAVRSVGDILVAGGGHTMAAGFTIKTSDLDTFIIRIQEYSRSALTEDILKRKLKIDMKLQFSEINWNLEEKISQFAPFGTGNFAPLFLTEDVSIKRLKTIGHDATHLKLILQAEGREFDGIGFGMAQNFSELHEDDRVDVVYYLEKNQWNGHENLQLRIKDMKIR